MGNIFIPNERHIQILDEIGRWKVIGMRELQRSLCVETLPTSFNRTIRKLESAGLIQSFLGSRKKKYLNLSVEGGKYSRFSSPFAENKTELRHDLLASNILQKLLEFNGFSSGQIINEELEVIPDALIYGAKRSMEYSLALEVELHQKSKKRVVNKLSKYADSRIFNYVLYVTNKRSIYDSYRKIVNELNEDVQKKVMIGLSENLSEQSFAYEDLRVHFKGVEKYFMEMFV